MPGYDELAEHLSSFTSLPFLFVGSGLSRRYLELDTWTALLERLSWSTSHPYAYFRTKGIDVPPALHQLWQRKCMIYGGKMTGSKLAAMPLVQESARVKAHSRSK